MIDPNQKRPQDEEDTTERKPEVERETLRDLTPAEEQAEGVKGGGTVPVEEQCENMSA